MAFLSRAWAAGGLRPTGAAQLCVLCLFAGQEKKENASGAGFSGCPGPASCWPEQMWFPWQLHPAVLGASEGFHGVFSDGHFVV